MPSADQVPVKTSHSTMRWHMWVVLIAGSTGSALRAVRPPNLHIAPDVGTISLRRECDGFLVALTLGHYGPRHPRDLISERDRGDLRWPPRQQCREPGPMFRAMDLGIADDRQRARREQAAQIAISLLADTAELVLTPRSSVTWARARSRPRNSAQIGKPSDRRRWRPERWPARDRRRESHRAVCSSRWIGARR